jgi:hypothetical protein
VKTSTLEDILQHKTVLVKHARKIINADTYCNDIDAWESLIIEDQAFDFNVFIWEEDNGDEVTHISVYPVEFKDSQEYGDTDYSTYLRLVTFNPKTGKITDVSNNSVEEKQ